MLSELVDTSSHPIRDPRYAADCGARLERAGALVLNGFLSPPTLAELVDEYDGREGDAFYADSTHNVYLTETNPDLPVDHTFNRLVISSKGLVADDQIPVESPLREIYDNHAFRTFLCRVLGIEEIHAYADNVSSINVHFAPDGRELGWHFDNSSFAVTLLLRSPEDGGAFEYVPNVRDADRGEMGFERVGRILDGAEPVESLEFNPGDLVLFRGRNSIHRITPTVGEVTRLLVVFAYNTEPGVALSSSARSTFYGR